MVTARALHSASSRLRNLRAGPDHNDGTTHNATANVRRALIQEDVNFCATGVTGSPIRNLADTNTLLNFALSNAQITFVRVLGFYRPDELPLYGRKYLDDWRAAFRGLHK